MKTVRRLATELRRTEARLLGDDVEGFAEHPLAKAGVLKFAGLCDPWRCTACAERCCAEVRAPYQYARKDGSQGWAVTCAQSFQKVDVSSQHVAAIWTYNEKRMAETLRDILNCVEARRDPTTGTWRLGRSNLHDLPAFEFAYLNRIDSAAERDVARSVIADSRTILIAGFINSDVLLPEMSERTYALSDILKISGCGQLYVDKEILCRVTGNRSKTVAYPHSVPHENLVRESYLAYNSQAVTTEDLVQKIDDLSAGLPIAVATIRADVHSEGKKTRDEIKRSRKSNRTRFSEIAQEEAHLVWEKYRRDKSIAPSSKGRKLRYEDVFNYAKAELAALSEPITSAEEFERCLGARIDRISKSQGKKPQK